MKRKLWRKLVDNIDQIYTEIDNAINAVVDGDEYDNHKLRSAPGEVPLIASGEASFPVRVTQRQAEEISNYLIAVGFDYWSHEPIVKINPKSVYMLWISIDCYYRDYDMDDPYYYEASWGFRCVTESTDDETDTDTYPKHIYGWGRDVDADDDDDE